MEDFINFLIGIFFVGCIVYWIFTVAIPFVLTYLLVPGLAYGFMGWVFFCQLRRCRLTTKSKVVIGFIGLGSILISSVVVTSSHINGLWNLPIATALFLIVGNITLYSWAEGKIYLVKNEIKQLEWQLSTIEKTIAHNDSLLKKLASEKRKIENAFKDKIDHGKRLELKLQKICSQNARVYGLQKKKLEAAIRDLDDNDLAAEKTLLSRKLNHADKNNQSVGNAELIRYTLIRLEELQRTVGNPSKKLEAIAKKMAEIDGENRKLKSRAADLKKSISSQKARYEVTTSQGILLD